MRSWRQESFEAVIADESGGNLKTPQSEFLLSGRYPIVDQGKDLIAGYTDDESRLCRATLPVIVFGDHTRCFKYVDFPFCMGADGVKVLRPKVEADTKYLYHYLRQLRLTEGGYDRHFKYLKRTSIVLPPFPEQRRIAEILDKAETLRAKRRAAIAQLDTLTQSIFLDMFGDPATNPKGWPEVRLGEHASKIGSGATPLGGEAAYKSSGIALIRSMNVRNGRFTSEGLAFIDSDQAARLEGVVVEPDDVLLNITGASVARVCRAPGKVLPARVNQHVAIIRPTGGFEARFLEQCLLFPSMKRRLLRIAGAGATREAITKEAIERLVVIQPPRTLQEKFSGLVLARESLEIDQGAHLIASEDLFVALQHRAFRGEL